MQSFDIQFETAVVELFGNLADGVDCVLVLGLFQSIGEHGHPVSRHGEVLVEFKRVFDLMKDFGTSKSTKIDSIFDSLLVPR
ncbi:MAG: hypothetical protein ABW068_01755, partial [Candidatus Thiodiazotropha sp.]